MNRMKNYSILMTVYKNDNPKFVVEAIDSMVKQTVKTDDFVIVCDGPITDELNEVINNFEKENKGLFNVYRLEKNVGLGAALNYGVKQCKNELIARMDDDDISTNDRCEKQLKLFEEDPDLSLIGAYVYEFDENIQSNLILKKVPTSGEEIIKYSKRKNPFNHSTVMFKKGAILEIGNYSEMRTNQDVNLWVRLINAGYKCINIPEPLVYFRYDMGTLKRRKNYKNVKLLIEIWRDFRKKKYCSWLDYMYVVVRQYAIYFMPMFLLKKLYKRFR